MTTKMNLENFESERTTGPAHSRTLTQSGKLRCLPNKLVRDSG